jgi:AGZA family xanthine/uracil permease-like MFS transporter
MIQLLSVKLGDLSNPIVLLGCATFIAIIVMEKMKIKGNIIIGILGIQYYFMGCRISQF